MPPSRYAAKPFYRYAVLPLCRQAVRAGVAGLFNGAPLSSAAFGVII